MEIPAVVFVLPVQNTLDSLPWSVRIFLQWPKKRSDIHKKRPKRPPMEICCQMTAIEDLSEPWATSCEIKHERRGRLKTHTTSAPFLQDRITKRPQNGLYAITKRSVRCRGTRRASANYRCSAALGDVSLCMQRATSPPLTSSSPSSLRSSRVSARRCATAAASFYLLARCVRSPLVQKANCPTLGRINYRRPNEASSLSERGRTTLWEGRRAVNLSWNYWVKSTSSTPLATAVRFSTL